MIPNETVSLRDSAIESYLLQRTALYRHRSEFDLLNNEQRQDVIGEVKKQALIQRAVLSSTLAPDCIVSGDEVVAAIDEIESSFADAISFGAKLSSWGLSREMLRDVVAQELKVAKVLDVVEQQVEPVSEVECEIYYHMNTGKFFQPELRRLRHILVTVNEAYPENSRRAALKRIMEVEQQLVSGSENFESLALRYSECPTSLQGGDLGWIAPGQLYKSLDEVAQRLQCGERCAGVESELGFHILRCDEIRAAKQSSFEEVKDQLKEQLTLRNRRRAQKRWLQQQVANMQPKKG